jgi:MFS family permease
MATNIEPQFSLWICLTSSKSKAIADMAAVSLKTPLYRLKKSISYLTLGGDWTIALPLDIKHNLRWFWYDGLFAASSDNIILTYLVLYLLSLGATRTQIGLMSSFSSLSTAILLLPGALLVERIAHRKGIILTCGGGIGRLMILAMALVPLVLDKQALVWIVIALSVTRDSMSNFSFPAWMSITGDIVPLEGRGRYFGSRNFIMGIAGMTTILLVGEWITHTEKPLGYQLAIGLAFLLGIASTFSFSRIKDPLDGSASPTWASFKFSGLIHEMRMHPPFVALCAVNALWNFSINIAGPFFTVYMVQNLEATATMVGIVSILATLFSLSIQRKVGGLTDRWGPQRMQLLSMLLIPILPACWAFTNAMWQIYIINSLSGILWGAFNLASFHFLLTLTPEAQRARYSALYQIAVTLSLAAGAALGSWIVTQWGYQGVFLCSALGRMISALFFARFVLAPVPVGKEAIVKI